MAERGSAVDDADGVKMEALRGVDQGLGRDRAIEDVVPARDRRERVAERWSGVCRRQEGVLRLIAWEQALAIDRRRKQF